MDKEFESPDESYSVSEIQEYLKKSMEKRLMIILILR